MRTTTALLALLVAGATATSAATVKENWDTSCASCHGEDGKVTEFLLVPYVGACIHEPTPPPNQIVYVKYTGGIEITSRFIAVSVTGSLRAVFSQPLLRLVDGAANIPTAYALDAKTVEVHEQVGTPKSLWRPQTGPAFQ